MLRKSILILTVLTLAVGALITEPNRPAAARTGRTSAVKIGLVDSLLRDRPEHLVQLGMKPFRSYLEKQTACHGEVVAGGSPLALGRKIKEGKLDLGVFHGIEFAWAHEKYPTLKPLVLILKRHKDVHALLVVRRDCNVKGCDDLQGKLVALPHGCREDCRLFLERRCAKADTPAAKFYAKIITPADGMDALDAVFDNEVHAAVIEDVVWEDYRKLKPARSGHLKALLESESFPCGVLAYQPRNLSAAQVKRIRNALVNAKSNSRGQQMLRILGLTGFQPAPPNFCEGLAEIAKAYPCPASSGPAGFTPVSGRPPAPSGKLHTPAQ
jgi:ABC-type phosphate/phosphonate transport system substrate-binding protein